MCVLALRFTPRALDPEVVIRASCEHRAENTTDVL